MTDPLSSTPNYNSVTPTTSPSAFTKEGTLQTQRTRLEINVVETRPSMHNVILRRGSDYLCHGKAINITYLCVCVCVCVCGRACVRALRSVGMCKCVHVVLRIQHARNNLARYCHQCENVFMESARYFCRILMKL
jgi:hypothetical protein